MAQAKVSFSPYSAALEFGHVKSKGGINWTWVAFPTLEAMQKFDKACISHGYRVRRYETMDVPGQEYWTQYHHYED